MQLTNVSNGDGKSTVTSKEISRQRLNTRFADLDARNTRITDVKNRGTQTSSKVNLLSSSRGGN